MIRLKNFVRTRRWEKVFGHLNIQRGKKNLDDIDNWWKIGKSMKFLKYTYQIKLIRFEYLCIKKNRWFQETKIRKMKIDMKTILQLYHLYEMNK